jgi:prepilin-type processing-associated H-X9-DG protein
VLLAYEKIDNHCHAKANVLFADGHVEVFTADALQAQIEATRKRLPDMVK